MFEKLSKDIFDKLKTMLEIQIMDTIFLPYPG